MVKYFVFVFCLLGLLGSGCRTTHPLESPNAGRVMNYDPGTPSFDYETVTTWINTTPELNVHLNIPRRSLIFVRDDQAYKATFEFTVRLRDRKEKTVRYEKTDRDTLRMDQYEQTLTYTPILRSMQVTTTPGSYILELSVTDRQSGKQSERKQYLTIEALVPDEAALSQIILSGSRNGSTPEPLVSLYVPEDTDSMKAALHVYQLQERDTVNVTMSLLRYKNDTTVAVPPFWLTPVFGSLFYKGIDYSKPDTVQITHRLIHELDGSADIHFILPKLPDGLYRVDISISGTGKSSKKNPVLSRRRRDFLITSSGFPEIVTLDQMVETLTYLARKKELEPLQKARDELERKRKYDAFWGSIVPNRELAASVIRLYYSRVEEANLLFTNFKEGWKTDRGMIYVVLGAPSYIERTPSQETWHYTFGDLQTAQTFTFQRKKVVNSDPQFETYSLERNPNYESLWTRALSRWREGVVL